LPEGPAGREIVMRCLRRDSQLVTNDKIKDGQAKYSLYM
jgi:hypothetical protein